MKKVILFLSVLSMLVLMLGTTVCASEEYTPTDTYILNFSNQDIPGYEAYDSKRLYASDHYAGLYVDEDGDGVNEADWNWTCFSVLNMINTSKLEEGGEGAYATIPAYCVDAVTDGLPGHEYRRVNLEESSYFSAEVSGRLRAVILNSFPYITNMSDIESAVNTWATEETKVKNLTESEVISATQAAVWTLTNNAEVYAPYLGTGSYYSEDDMVDTSVFRQKSTEYTEDNITLLYNYLMALAPVSPCDTLVSNASFANAKISLTPSENGEFTAEIETDITASVYGGTALTLTAVVNGNALACVPVKDGTNTYTIELSGVNENDSFTLAIDGLQSASDVFLFDPLNGRGASQTMAGFDSSTLPVHAQILVTPQIILPEDDPIEDRDNTDSDTPIENTPADNTSEDVPEYNNEIKNPETDDEYIPAAFIALFLAMCVTFIPKRKKTD